MQFVNAGESLRRCRPFLNRQSQRLLTDSHQQSDIPGEEVRKEEKRQGEGKIERDRRGAEYGLTKTDGDTKERVGHREK